ncbi:MAG: hypothetical protein JWP57_4585 [Spirosoma sp.]|nr:hypothetical protein [Spirosoma sp.]
MSFPAQVLRVLIASPSDTSEERDACERAIHSWNASRAEREQVILLPQRWESHAVPRLGGTGQEIINDQLVDKSDIVIALFDSRLGSATATAVSGTAEEIQRAHRAGKPVHVWFSDEPLPRDTDPDQLRALQEFRKAIADEGLLGSYASPDDLQFQVRAAIEQDVTLLDTASPPAVQSGPTGAVLRARYEADREPHMDSRGRTKMRTRRERVVVQNTGTATAEDVTIELRAANPSEEPPRMHDGRPATILPSSEYAWMILGFAGTALSYDVVMTWHESDVPRSETQHITEF